MAKMLIANPRSQQWRQTDLKVNLSYVAVSFSQKQKPKQQLNKQERQNQTDKTDNC